jgi:hypothetical protein
MRLGIALVALLAVGLTVGSSYAGLDFEKQVRPVLDGHLVIGTVLRRA